MFTDETEKSPRETSGFFIYLMKFISFKNSNVMFIDFI